MHNTRGNRNRLVVRAQQSSAPLVPPVGAMDALGQMLGAMGMGASGGDVPRSTRLEDLVPAAGFWEMKAGEGGKKIQNIVANSKAPATHKFAASVSGFSAKDVSKAIGGDKSLLDKAFEGCTPLDLAIASDNTSRLQALLEMGADPNCTNGLAQKPVAGGDCLPSHPIYTAIFFARPKCLQMLLDAKSSVVTSYPGRKNETVTFAVTLISHSPVGSGAEKVVEILLETKEGKEAVDVTHSSISLTAFTACMRSFKTKPGMKEGHSRAMKDTLTRILERLVRAGANFNHPTIQTPIVAWACQEKVRAKTISLMLLEGAPPNGYILSNNGSTCLIAAVENNHADAVKLLLSHGVDVNETGPNGQTPFGTALKLEDKTCLYKLINHKDFRFKRSEMLMAKTILSESELASPEAKFYSYSRGVSVAKETKRPKKKNKGKLFELMSAGDFDDFVKGLDACAVSDINAKDDEGMTLLHLATIKNDYDMVETLLNKGAGVGIQNKRGYEPIMYAAKNQNSLEILDLLMCNGADINAKETSGKTAVFEAAQANRVENVEYLCVSKNGSVNIGETSTGTTPVHLMAQENNTNILNVLSQSLNFNVNITNLSGASPLHYSAKSDSEQAARRLIELGADIDMKCFAKGSTPLHVAAACNSEKISQILIQKGANINAQNNQEETPLFVAAMSGSKSVLTLLVEEKAEMDAKNIHGQTPLYIAVNYEEYEVARFLVDHGADFMARERHRNETILHLATSLGNADFISFLIKRGADKEARDCQSLTPFLRTAIMKTKPGLAQWLFGLGCDPNATLAVNPMLNFLDITMHNKNLKVFHEAIITCPRTNKPKVHPMLKKLPKESKEKALHLWKVYNFFEGARQQGSDENIVNQILSQAFS